MASSALRTDSSAWFAPATSASCTCAAVARGFIRRPPGTPSEPPPGRHGGVQASERELRIGGFGEGTPSELRRCFFVFAFLQEELTLEQLRRGILVVCPQYLIDQQMCFCVIPGSRVSSG